MPQAETVYYGDSLSQTVTSCAIFSLMDKLFECMNLGAALCHILKTVSEVVYVVGQHYVTTSNQCPSLCMWSKLSPVCYAVLDHFIYVGAAGIVVYLEHAYLFIASVCLVTLNGLSLGNTIRWNTKWLILCNAISLSANVKCATIVQADIEVM
jgi:hypothetical protein